MPRATDLLLGSHVSVAGGLATAFPRAASLGCTAMQIFVKNASQWRGKVLGDEEVAAFRAARAGGFRGPIFAHASYLINLASAEEELLARSIAALADELERCRRLGLDGLVFHPGAHMGAGEEVGLECVAASMAAVLAAVPADAPPLLIENTAGQGSCLGHRLEHLETLRALAAPADFGRIGFCLDTCHALAAGYALHEPAGMADFLAEVERRLGWSAVRCFHINDSVQGCGSRRDRHASLGEGQVGLAAFAALLADERTRRLPMIVETETGDEMAGHRKDLETLRGLWHRIQSTAGGSPRPSRPGRADGRRAKNS